MPTWRRYHPVVMVNYNNWVTAKYTEELERRAVPLICTNFLYNKVALRGSFDKQGLNFTREDLEKDLLCTRTQCRNV